MKYDSGYNRAINKENGLLYTMGGEADLFIINSSLGQIGDNSLKWESKDGRIVHYERQDRKTEATVARLSCGIGVAVGCFQKNVIATFYVFPERELPEIIRLERKAVSVGSILPLADLGFETDYQKLQSHKGGLGVPGCYALQDIYTSPAPMTPLTWDGSATVWSSRLYDLPTGYYLACKKHWMFVPYHVHYMFPSVRPTAYIFPWMLYHNAYCGKGIPTEGRMELYLTPIRAAEPPSEIRDAILHKPFLASVRWGNAILDWDAFVCLESGDIAIRFPEIVAT